MNINITTGQSILLGLLGGIALISWIYTFFYMNRALMVSALAGLILGHAKEAIIFGAAAELIYLGLINAAGVVPPNPLGPGIFGVVFLLTNKDMPIGTAITLSMPFAIFVQFLITLIFTINSPIGSIMEKLVKKERWILYRISGHATAILLFISGFVLGISAGLGAATFRDAISKIPDWFQKGLGVGGAMLPAMGFAVVLRLMLKKEYIPFLFVGYALVVIFQGVGAAKPEWGFNLVAIAITAIGVALVIFNSNILSKKGITNNNQRGQEEVTDGI